MAPDWGDGGRSASAGIAAEPQVSRHRAPRSQGSCAFTATSTTLRSRAPSPAQGAAPPSRPSTLLRGVFSLVPPAPLL